MRDRTRCLLSAALSCAVYAAPVASVHWVDFFGVVLVRELSSGREPAWLAADILLALACQAALALVAWWGLGRGRGAAVGLVLVTWLPLVYGVNVAYMVAIPSLFLIESDTTPDQNTWIEQCGAPGAWLDSAPAGITRGLEARGEAVVRVGDTRFGILRASDCAVEPIPIPELPITPGVQQVLPDGSVVYAAQARGVPGQTYWLLRRGQTEAVRLEPPPGTEGAPYPVVSDDGRWVAWPLRSPERVVTISVSPLDGGAPILLTHDLFQRASFGMLELDMLRRLVTVSRDLSSFVSVRLDGSVAWGPLSPADVAAQDSTFRYADGQWLGWDAYVEGRAKRATWSTAEGSGRYTLPKGRGITAGALHPTGRYVALSTTTDLNIGSIQDTVLVRRARDGTEVFRRTLTPYTRSHVAFLGTDYFAYSEVSGTTATTRVLRLPAETQVDSPTRP